MPKFYDATVKEVNDRPVEIRIHGEDVTKDFLEKLSRQTGTKVIKEKNEERSKNLDCGIAMLHLEVGALKAGVSGSWEYLKGKEVARFLVE